MFQLASRLSILRRERGQTLLLFVLIFTVFLAMAAVVIDQGVWVGHRRVSQKDADTAARGGAMAYLKDINGDLAARLQAQLVAQNNGTDPSSAFVSSLTTGCIKFDGTQIADVPSVEAQIHRQVDPLVKVTGWFTGLVGAPVDTAARATACVGRPSEAEGGDPYYTAPGSVSDPCFQANGQPAIGVACVFKTDSGSQQFGGRGNLSLADSPPNCTQKPKKDLEEQIAVGSDAICKVGDVVQIAQGDNTAQNIQGLNCRLAGGCDGAIGEGACDQGFHDPNGSIPPFTGSLTTKIDDFTEVFSRPGGGPPLSDWATNGETLIPNICDGHRSPRIMTIIIAEPCPPEGCQQTITIAGFATFYVYGCTKLDKDDQPTGPIDLQCADINGDSGVLGLFVKAFFPEGGGTPLPPVDGASLSIFLVR